MKTVKPFWQSKTLWFNFASGVVLIVGNLIANPAIHLSPTANLVAAGIISIVNLFLRMVTTQGVAQSQQSANTINLVNSVSGTQSQPPTSLPKI